MFKNLENGLYFLVGNRVKKKEILLTPQFQFDSNVTVQKKKIVKDVFKIQIIDAMFWQTFAMFANVC